MFTPLNSRGGCYFFLDKKVTKKSSQQKCFFAAPGLSRTKPKKLRAGIVFRRLFIFLWRSRLLRSFAGLPYPAQTLYAKISYALPDTQAGSFLAFFRSLSADGKPQAQDIQL
jgi:hypothetical protein